MMNMKLEVLVIPVSDVDRAKAFYEKLGFRLDIDYAPDDKFRVLQFTPPSSEASIIFGKGITSKKPGSADGLTLAVEDVDAARKDLIARGVAVSEVFHYAGGPIQQLHPEPTCRWARPARSFLLFFCFVRRSGWEQLAAAGNHNPPPWPRMEVDASTSHGRVKPRRAAPRDRETPRSVREDARCASLVGLVRALPKRASKRQQSGGGSRRRQPLYGRRPSCSGTMSL